MKQRLNIVVLLMALAAFLFPSTSVGTLLFEDARGGTVLYEASDFGDLDFVDESPTFRYENLNKWLGVNGLLYEQFTYPFSEISVPKEDYLFQLASSSGGTWSDLTTKWRFTASGPGTVATVRFTANTTEYQGEWVIMQIEYSASQPSGSNLINYFVDGVKQFNPVDWFDYPVRWLNTYTVDPTTEITYSRIFVPNGCTFIELYFSNASTASTEWFDFYDMKIFVEADWAREAYHFKERNRNLHTHLFSEEQGVTTDADFNFALCGDSWTHGNSRLLDQLVAKLKAIGQIRAPGYGGFSMYTATGIDGWADAALTSGSKTGTWSTYEDIKGLTAGTTSSTATDSINISITDDCDIVKVHYWDTATGVWRWRVNGGGWTTVNNAGTDTLIISDLGQNMAAGWTFDIEVVSGDCTFYGLYLDESTADGYCVNKVARSGGVISQFVEYPATYKQAMDDINPDLVTVMFGTNEQSSKADPDLFGRNYRQYAQNLRNVERDSDCVFMTPFKNVADVREGLRPMEIYRDEMYKAASMSEASFIDYINIFGSAPELYEDGTVRSWLAADEIHPSANGSVLLSGTLLEFLGL